MRLFALLLAALPVSTAFANPHSHRPDHHRPPPPPQVCEAGELRVSAARNEWFDVYVDGVQRIESRVMDGQQAIALAPGRHHVRVTNFMGRVWSEEILDVRCGEVLVGEVHDRAGLSLLTRWAAPPPPPPQYGHRPAPPPRVCTAGSLGISPFQNAWYDVYVDGQKVIESRNFESQQVVWDLAPGTHHVRVTSFVGDVWSEDWVDIGCGQQLAAEVQQDRGLRVF
ncbi:MAG: hypothetical protein H6737_11900 [Alphaproteobacteria bacterium]|nr:hypothetical protein [Alphaproteobacteria bacterium]